MSYFNEELQKMMQKELDTRDKRYMFLRINFPQHVHRINIEGSTYQACMNIEDHFKKQNMDGSFASCFRVHFDPTLE